MTHSPTDTNDRPPNSADNPADSKEMAEDNTLAKAFEKEAATPATRDETIAAVFYGTDRPLAFERVTLPPPEPGEVVIDIVANGACHSDVHKLQGHGLVEAPCVFGHEISGTIAEIGSTVTSLHVGDRVVCSFLVPCGVCSACSSGNEDLCLPFRSHMQKLGVRFDGTPRMYAANGEPLRTSGVGGL